MKLKNALKVSIVLSLGLVTNLQARELNIELPERPIYREYEEDRGLTNIPFRVHPNNVISSEIVYVVGIPMLFESYIYNGATVSIVSLLTNSHYGYRVVIAGEYTEADFPNNFVDILEYMNIQKNRGYSVDIDYIDMHSTVPGTNVPWRNRDISDDIAPYFLGGFGSGRVIPPGRVRHWFDFGVDTGPGTRVFIGAGGLSVSVLSINPNYFLSLNETIIINNLAISPSLPPSFGVALTPNTLHFAHSAENVFAISAHRPGFNNSWVVPTFFADLVSINTTGHIGIRENNAIIIRNQASVRSVATQF